MAVTGHPRLHLEHSKCSVSLSRQEGSTLLFDAAVTKQHSDYTMHVGKRTCLCTILRAELLRHSTELAVNVPGPATGEFLKL